MLWRVDLPVHHDATLAPDGRIRVLVSADRPLAAIDSAAPTRDDGIAFLTLDGRVQEQRFFAGMWIAQAREFPIRRSPGAAIAKGRILDLFHTNALAWMTNRRLAELHSIYTLGNALVTMRNQDAVAVLDWDAHRIVWLWGPGELLGPHDASLLENGNFLVFDNQLGTGALRVIELDPLARKAVWEYRATEPTQFDSRSPGSAQRLANGNTLIAESDRGHAFEVTREGRLVWDFWNPDRDADGHPATIIRMTRYSTDSVDRILADRAAMH